LTRIAFAFSSLLALSDLGGQVPIESSIETLKPGETVRIRMTGGETIESRLVSVQPEPLGLQLARPGTILDADAIDSLWVKGRATQAGTNIGALVGGVLSFAFWAAVCTGVGYGSGCDAWGTVAALGVGGAIGGALIGAGIGSRVPRWQLRYARR
jgi:hypothetical protein